MFISSVAACKHLKNGTNRRKISDASAALRGDDFQQMLNTQIPSATVCVSGKANLVNVRLEPSWHTAV